MRRKLDKKCPIYFQHMISLFTINIQTRKDIILLYNKDENVVLILPLVKFN